jgi:hypothetical protein
MPKRTDLPFCFIASEARQSRAFVRGSGLPRRFASRNDELGSVSCGKATLSTTPANVIRALLFGLALSLGLSSPLLAKETITTDDGTTFQDFGAWQLSSKPTPDFGVKTGFVRIDQSQNRDEDGIGDELTIHWTGWESKIDFRLIIFKCNKDPYQFERSTSLDGRAWTSIGAKAATVQYKTMLNGWIKEAVAICTDIKPARIFKMAKLDKAITAFLPKVAQYSAIVAGKP